MKDVDDSGLSVKTIERVVHDVGPELAERRDADPRTDYALAGHPASPPELAVVECDGGCIRTRKPGQGPGIHCNADGWRETKNTVLIRATRTVSGDDSQSELPECFCNPEHVAKIAETEAPAVVSSSAATCGPEEHSDSAQPITASAWRSKWLVRTVLASITGSKDFGKQVEREAKQRRLFEAKAKAFLGDGLSWNWSIWKRHFPEFTPILDFIHVLSYLFLTAKAVHHAAEDTWSQYLAWMRGAWRGEVAQVLEELQMWQVKLGIPDTDTPDSDPRKVLMTSINYLENNRDRMRYPEYRQAGLPVTTAWMESLVKEMNYRVKGIEMFWNDPDRAEAILQVRAAALYDDNRLTKHLRTRPGCPFTRRPRSPKPGSEKIRS